MFPLLVFLVSVQLQIPYKLNPNAKVEEDEISYASPMEFESVPMDIKAGLTKLGLPFTHILHRAH